MDVRTYVCIRDDNRCFLKFTSVGVDSLIFEDASG